MAAPPPQAVAEDLVRRIAADLRERYGLSEAQVRGLGEQLSGVPPREDRLTDDEIEAIQIRHRATLDRLAR